MDISSLLGWQIFVIALLGGIPALLVALTNLTIALRDLVMTRKVSRHVVGLRKQINGGVPVKADSLPREVAVGEAVLSDSQISKLARIIALSVAEGVRAVLREEMAARFSGSPAVQSTDPIPASKKVGE